MFSFQYLLNSTWSYTELNAYIEILEPVHFHDFLELFGFELSELSEIV